MDKTKVQYQEINQMKRIPRQTIIYILKIFARKQQLTGTVCNNHQSIRQTKNNNLDRSFEYSLKAAIVSKRNRQALYQK